MALSAPTLELYARTADEGSSEVAYGAAAFVTPSFTPTANSILVAFTFAYDNFSNAPVVTLVDSAGSTWTKRHEFQMLKNVDGVAGDALDCHVAVWTTTVGASPAARTLSLDEASNKSMFSYSVRVISFTGYDTSSPVGGKGLVKNGSTASGITLDAAPAASSYVIGFQGLADDPGDAISPWTGFTELNQGYTWFLESSINYRTGTTSTGISFGTTTPRYAGYGICGIAIEIKASGATAYEIDADVGAYSLTGIAAGLAGTRKVAAEAGTFSLTGIAAGLALGRKVSGEAGAFTLTGQDAGGPFTRRLIAELGAYALNGQAANIVRGLKLAAEAAAYILSGQDVSEGQAYTLDAEVGEYELSGQDVALPRGLRLIAELGSYTLAGQDVVFPITYQLTAAAGAYILAGQDVSAEVGYKISAEAGEYILSGIDANFLRGFKIIAEGSSYEVTGLDAGELYGKILGAEIGEYLLTGEAVRSAFLEFVLTPLPGGYQVVGQDVILRKGVKRTWVEESSSSASIWTEEAAKSRLTVL